MIEGYLDGSRDLRYDAIAALMADYCERNKAMGRCDGEHKTCRFALCPFNEGESPTNPNVWVDALYKSECGIWKKATERVEERFKNATQVKKPSNSAKQEPSKEPEPEKSSGKKASSIGGWFRKWLTLK